MNAALLVLALLAQAAPPPAPAPAAPAPAEDADALIAEAARQYDQDQLAEALQTLERAYAASPRPAILFNMAQVQRAKGDCAAARAAYARFIADAAPGDPNRDRAERRQSEMQACLDRQAASATTAAPPAPKPESAAPAPGAQLALQSPLPAPSAAVRTPAPPALPTPHDTWRPRARVAAWALAGLGTLAGGTAAVLAWRAAKDAAQLSDPVLHHWNQALDQEGRRYASWARWLGIGAAVAGGGAVTLFVVTRRPNETALSTPRRQFAAMVGWSTDF